MGLENPRCRAIGRPDHDRFLTVTISIYTDLYFAKRCLLHFGSTDASVMPIWGENQILLRHGGNDVILGPVMELIMDGFGAGTGVTVF